MTLRFAPNLSLLWAGLPLADRFERAAAAGFDAVELWWPGDDYALALPGLTERWGLRLAATADRRPAAAVPSAAGRGAWRRGPYRGACRR
jgi:hydroxypyruvate isomerase